MAEQPCPACGAQYDTTIGAKFCPKCGAALPEAVPAEPALAEGVLDVTVGPETPEPAAAPPPVEVGVPLVVDLPAAPEAAPAPLVAPEPPAAPAPPVAPAAPAGPLDQVPCPHCGEMLYTTEKICWKCGNSTEASAPATAEATAPADPPPPVAPFAVPVAPAPPSAGAAPVPPAPPMPSAVPPPPPAPGILGPPPRPGYTVGPTGPMPTPALSPEAQSVGYWALGLGIGSVVICPIAGPFAIWMGSRAYKLGNTAMGIVGMVCGGVGVLGLLASIGFVILGIVGAAAQHH